LINVVAARSFRGLADTIEVRRVSGRNFGPVPKRNRPAVNGRRKAANSLNRWLRSRRYIFHPDEVAEAEAQGLPYLLVPQGLFERPGMDGAMERYAFGRPCPARRVRAPRNLIPSQRLANHHPRSSPA
jgi:hypothetical protein